MAAPAPPFAGPSPPPAPAGTPPSQEAQYLALIDQRLQSMQRVLARRYNGSAGFGALLMVGGILGGLVAMANGEMAACFLAVLIFVRGIEHSAGY